MLAGQMKSTVIILSLFAFFSLCRGAVETGLDRITAYEKIFRGKRIGIITNHTAYDSEGRYIVDVFRVMPDATVAALFSPEHGLWGAEQAGRKTDSQMHPTYNLPIRSLYGKTRKPTPQMLSDIDVLVFDIQDIGARFYTYIYTMSLAMEAAAENGKRFVVLDRPNPITGYHVSGTILDPKLASFVGLFPIPVRHGMTAGELAKMFNEQGWLADGVKADLTVIPMKGWHRRMWYDQTALRFIKPSPNMPDLETALVYPGLCLLEGTNVSEARGTDKPFRQFGAPWIDSKSLAERLNTLKLPAMCFEPVRFTPTSSKYNGQTCNGARIVTTDRDRLEPYFSGVRIVNEIYRMYPDKFEWKVGHFDRLCGTPKVRRAILSGASLKELRGEWQAELQAFRRIRQEYLIYRD
ncbi:MAG: exo-beta-N-acetylmuramidase NamZ family protein [Planctomycetota bacterium]|jgi:beta-N-acetylhexosaminidase